MTFLKINENNNQEITTILNKIDTIIADEIVRRYNSLGINNKEELKVFISNIEKMNEDNIINKLRHSVEDVNTLRLQFINYAIENIELKENFGGIITKNYGNDILRFIEPFLTILKEHLIDFKDSLSEYALKEKHLSGIMGFLRKQKRALDIKVSDILLNEPSAEKKEDYEILKRINLSYNKIILFKETLKAMIRKEVEIDIQNVIAKAENDISIEKRRKNELEIIERNSQGGFKKIQEEFSKLNEKVTHVEAHSEYLKRQIKRRTNFFILGLIIIVIILIISKYI